MDSQKSSFFFKSLFLLVSFTLLLSLAEDFGERFLLPEGASIAVTVLDTNLSSPAERMLAKPLLPALLAWLSPCRSLRTLWPFVCAMGGTLLGAALFHALRFSAHFFISLLCLLPAVFSVPLLFVVTTDPAGALGLFFFTLAVTNMLEHLRTGRTFSLFTAGVCLGMIPFGISWGVFLVLGFFLVNRLLVETEKHGFLAEYVVLFMPFLLFGGGWWFLHWVYRQGQALFPSLSFPLQEMPNFPLSAGLLLCGALGVLLLLRCGKNRRDCAISFRFFFLVFLAFGMAWVFSPPVEARLRLLLLGMGVILVFLGYTLLPLKNRFLGILFLVFFCVGTWWELPERSENLALWKRALARENVLSSLYPEDYRIGAFLRRSFPGSSVAIEGRAPVVEYLAGDDVNFVSLYDSSSPQYMLRPFFFLPGEDEEVLAHTSHWLLIRKNMSP